MAIAELLVYCYLMGKLFSMYLFVRFNILMGKLYTGLVQVLPLIPTQNLKCKNSSIRLKFLRDYNAEIKNHYFTGTYRVKIILYPNGIFKYEVAELPQKDSFTAKIVPLTQIQDKRILTNKTTNRDHLAHNHETDLILLYDESGKILEF